MTASPLARRVDVLETTLTGLEQEVRAFRAEFGEFRTDTAAQFVHVGDELAKLRTDTTAQFAQVRGELATLRTDTAAQFAQVRGEFAEFRTDTVAQFAQIRGQFEELGRHMRLLHEDVIARIGLIQEAVSRPKPDRRRKH